MDECLLDLHTHSTFSDGTASPEELVRRAKEIGLSAIALTDHNTSAGLPDFMEAGEKEGLRTIPGTELSTTCNGHEVHILGLFIPEEHWDDITEYTKQLWIAKNESNIALARALTEAGCPVDYEKMRSESPSGQINRSKFGDELEKKGYMTKKEAFMSVLRPRSKGGLYEAPKRPGSIKTVQFLRDIGAVPVLAHAFLNFKDPDELDEFLTEAKKHGLAGMEVFYSTFTDDQHEKALELAKKHGLAPSGGSDYHGLAKPDIALGFGRGNLRVPCEVLPALEAARPGRDVRGT